jgi:hypothetical protein
LVNFGDTTSYGSINIFKDLNIFGNIRAVLPNEAVFFNTDVEISGDLKVNNITAENFDFLGVTKFDSLEVTKHRRLCKQHRIFNIISVNK